MLFKLSKFALLSSAAILAASCASAFNGADDALTVSERHPISVDGQVVTLTIDTNSASSELSSVDKSRLRAFADSYLRNGHGPLTITAPSGSPEDFDGQEAAADIREALHKYGVPWSTLSGATYRTGGVAGGNQMIVSYTHYVATASECGIWSGIKAREYANLASPNYGCATQNNIAAMLADPHDLIAPADGSPRDAAAIVRAFEAYREGETTVSEIDKEINTELSK
ncbi:MAG: pilus assembly protein [Hyphococcus sp.]|nr:MAG: pilus assembly protein [Marinicaulis sp.]